jgi:hypothetical protein
MTSYRILVARTVTVTNNIYIDAESEADARARFEHLLENDASAFTDDDWGEAFYYQIIKAGEAVGHFEILEIEED